MTWLWGWGGSVSTAPRGTCGLWKLSCHSSSRVSQLSRFQHVSSAACLLMSAKKYGQLPTLINCRGWCMLVLWFETGNCVKLKTFPKNVDANLSHTSHLCCASDWLPQIPVR